MKAFRIIAAAATASALSMGAAQAAGPSLGVIDHDWSFEGPLGTFDRAELQRGWQVFMQVCASCHGLEHVAFRNLTEPGGPGFSEEQVKAMAAEWQVWDVNSEGEPEQRPAGLADRMVKWRNEAEAAAANGGALPPDMSLITKARTGYTGTFTQIMEGIGGPEYVYSLLLGYTDEPPAGFDVGDLNYNKYFPGHRIAMGQPLWGDDVEYQDGTEATIEQQAHDVVAFLTWAAEPSMEERKQAGVRNIIFLTIFAVLLWFSNRQLWKPVKEGKV